MIKTINIVGRMLTFSRLRVYTDNLDDIRTELQALRQSSMGKIPVLIDSLVEIDLQTLLNTLWELDIQAIGVVDGILTEQASELHLAIFPAEGSRLNQLPESEDNAQSTPNTQDNNKDQDTPPTANTDEPTTQESPSADHTNTVGISSLVHRQMVRSGQCVQHLGGDLTIIGGVNVGAEAITDGSLHVYGHGLGRLVAGATGDKNARIFCQKFNPSLVSVAGTYCLQDDIPSELIDQAVEVSYDIEQGLIFNKLSL